jgi:hypothetical protein
MPSGRGGLTHPIFHKETHVDTIVQNLDLIVNGALLVLALLVPGAGAVALRTFQALQKVRLIDTTLSVQVQAAQLLAAATPRALAYARERAPNGSIWEQAAEAATYTLRTLPDTVARLNAGHDTLVMRYLAELRMRDGRPENISSPSEPY